MEIEQDRLMKAFEQLITLQAHYAGLLNQYDAGERIQFKSVDEWLKRLEELGKI